MSVILIPAMLVLCNDYDLPNMLYWPYTEVTILSPINGSTVALPKERSITSNFDERDANQSI